MKKVLYVEFFWPHFISFDGAKLYQISKFRYRSEVFPLQSRQEILSNASLGNVLQKARLDLLIRIFSHRIRKPQYWGILSYWSWNKWVGKQKILIFEHSLHKICKSSLFLAFKRGSKRQNNPLVIFIIISDIVNVEGPSYALVVKKDTIFETEGKCWIYIYTKSFVICTLLTTDIRFWWGWTKQNMR